MGAMEQPAGRPPARASDADRDRAARALRHHYAAGRLDVEELEQRLHLAGGARTRAELRRALAGLPRNRRGRLVGRLARAHRETLPAHAAGYVATNGALIAVWQLTGGGDFWPAWVLAPTTLMLGWHATATRMLSRAARRRRR